MAAAEARRVFVEMAAEKLGGVSAGQLTVKDGVVSATGDAGEKASYADLIGGKSSMCVSTGTANTATALCAGQGQAEFPEGLHHRRRADLRDDIAGKVFAQTDFAMDIKVPGMVHGRMIRPAVRRRRCR